MLHSPKTTEPIPGYVVQERIGVGGYGEVWSAQAPGGLVKAIKFVYGYFDDARASRELKALDRIKQVRHPFLLSLERFEVVDGQLVIVTELADGSLKDRYEEVRQSGLEGIARDELLAYLRDAADALDYMTENFSLQHLDVKPENLLLVGGRVKVADFGLVKNVHDVSASMMSGLTPIYAAPEVFDDRPSRFSDQYSLAIVYQEMLTGNLPFPGRTPAQLASQHLHASPRLATLPPADQCIVAQALAKNPLERFGNCRALVDALLSADRAPRTATKSVRAVEVPSNSDTSSVQAKTDTDTRTQILGAESAVAPCPLSPQAPPIEPIVNLPPVELADAAGALRPTLFVGIGGTAGKALRRLRRRLSDRFGASDVPAIQMLLLDTDAKNRCANDESLRESQLGDGETMTLPLRSAHDYTADSRKMLQWLSRRWLYNIPRSLQTEGRRPLGRLALVDHASQVTARLRAAIESIVSEQAIAASTSAVGTVFRGDFPRVIIVSSISGGTGGGMALDVTFAVRQVLNELGLPGEGVCEIFAHSTDRNPAAAELATANAYAFLTELAHYGQFGYTPGEPACGLTAVSGPRGALANSYFVNLGHGLNDQEYAAATDTLSSYLYLTTATSAAAVFDHCRAATVAEQDRSTLRSFSLTEIGSTHTALPGLVAETVCREVVDHWRGTSKASPDNGKSSLVDIVTRRAVACPTTGSGIAQLVAQHAAGLELTFASLREQVGAVMTKALGGDAATVLAKLGAQLDDSRPTASERSELLAGSIRGLFDPTAVTDDVPVPPAVELWAALDRALKPHASPKGQAIAAWILQFVNEPAVRVAGALDARQAYVRYLHDVEAESGAALRAVQQDLQSLDQLRCDTRKTAPARGRLFGARRAESKYAADVDRELQVMVELQVEACTLMAVSKFLRLAGAGVAAAGDRLKEFQHELGQWSQEFDGPTPWGSPDETAAAAGLADEVRAAMAGALLARLPQMVRDVDERFETKVLSASGGLRTVCEKADALRASTLAALRSEGRAEVFSALGLIGLSDVVLGPGAGEGGHSRLDTCLAVARSKLTDCGGGQRLVAILPEGSAGSTLRETIASQVDPPATFTTAADADLVFCYELQDLSLAHVAARLIDGRGDIIQIAGRLHTRVDVPWSQLPQPAPLRTAECAAHLT